MKKTILFTTESCTQCPLVKQMIEQKGLDVEYVDAFEKAELAAEYGVMSVPTLADTEEEKVLAQGQQQCLQWIHS